MRPASAPRTFVDIRDRDLGGYVADAKKAVAQQVQLPAGTYRIWSGQFEYLERAEARLQVVVPVTLMIIFLLLYLNFRRADRMGLEGVVSKRKDAPHRSGKGGG